jgi:hypothetical protein
MTRRFAHSVGANQLLGNLCARNAVERDAVDHYDLLDVLKLQALDQPQVWRVIRRPHRSRRSEVPQPCCLLLGNALCGLEGGEVDVDSRDLQCLEPLLPLSLHLQHRRQRGDLLLPGGPQVEDRLQGLPLVLDDPPSATCRFPTIREIDSKVFRVDSGRLISGSGICTVTGTRNS